MKKILSTHIPRYTCLALFVCLAICYFFNKITWGWSELPLFFGIGTLLLIVEIAGLLLIPLGLLHKKKKLSCIGCVLLMAHSLCFVVAHYLIFGKYLFVAYEGNYYIYDYLYLVTTAIAMIFAAVNCASKKRKPARLGGITVGLLIIAGYFELLFVNDGYLYIKLWQLYNEIYDLVSIPRLICYLAFFLLGYSFQESAQPIGELPLLKDLPKVTFSEVLSTYLAALLVPTAPIALIFLISSPILGILTILIMPVVFTYAHIQDKPIREKEEAERIRRSLELSMMKFENETRYGIKYTDSTPTVNTNRLRSDLMDYYGTAMHSGSPMAQADLIHVQGASDAELVREAQKSGFDLNKYTE